MTIDDDATEPATNVIDEAWNFAGQHYHDFLNRQPEQSGWDFWTNQIASCGNARSASTTMTPAQFVDQLNTNADVLSTSDRATAIAFFGGATNTSNLTARAQCLRQVAEDGDLHSAEFNRAFVLMQDFGYLRRNPNDQPDTDYSGFDFWLTKLNQFNGNFVNAEMVKAFIVSGEYRQRFGQ